MRAPIDSDRTYQIFKRDEDNTTVCIEVVKGPQQARRRIEEARTSSPTSDFFIFDPITEKTVDPSQPSAKPDPLTP